jgi:hypothetical protein
MSFLNISWVQALCLDSSISFGFKLRAWNLQYLSSFLLGRYGRPKHHDLIHGLIHGQVHGLVHGLVRPHGLVHGLVRLHGLVHGLVRPHGLVHGLVHCLVHCTTWSSSCCSAGSSFLAYTTVGYRTSTALPGTGTVGYSAWYQHKIIMRYAKLTRSYLSFSSCI